MMSVVLRVSMMSEGMPDEMIRSKYRVFSHADVPEPWLLWMPSRLSQLAVVALRVVTLRIMVRHEG